MVRSAETQGKAREGDEEKEPKVKVGAGSQGQEMNYLFQGSKLAEVKGRSEDVQLP